MDRLITYERIFTLLKRELLSKYEGQLNPEKTLHSPPTYTTFLLIDFGTRKNRMTSIQHIDHFEHGLRSRKYQWREQRHGDYVHGEGLEKQTGTVLTVGFMRSQNVLRTYPDTGHFDTPKSIRITIIKSFKLTVNASLVYLVYVLFLSIFYKSVTL